MKVIRQIDEKEKKRISDRWNRVNILNTILLISGSIYAWLVIKRKILLTEDVFLLSDILLGYFWLGMLGTSFAFFNHILKKRWLAFLIWSVLNIAFMAIPGRIESIPRILRLYLRHTKILLEEFFLFLPIFIIFYYLIPEIPKKWLKLTIFDKN